MNISFASDLKKFIDQQVESGAYDSAGEVVREAVRRMQAGAAVRADPQSWSVLGALADDDIMAVAFVVLQEAAKSAQEDLKAIMAKVKSITAAKREMRCLIARVSRDLADNDDNCDPPKRLKFAANGLGGERAYHEAQLPVPDPAAAGGVRFVRCDLHKGTIERAQQLRAVLDSLRDRLDSLSELSEMDALRLQMIMDKRSQLVATLSNITKKISETQSAIVQNLK
jgi:Arc/MetJ-type ribon-helix-helix transcriptional regulator